MSLLDRSIAALILCLAASASAAPIRDARIQKEIAGAVDAVIRQDQAAQRKVESLGSLGPREDLLVQIALYVEGSHSTEQSMAAALILHQLGFTPEEKMDAVLPHLEAAGPGLRRVLTEMLGTIDRVEGGEPDFQAYERRIREAKDPPASLIHYMYEVSPETALTTMDRVHGRSVPSREAEAIREILEHRAAKGGLAEDEIPRARAALAALARDPAWWRRLYAAAIAGRHADLATAETASRLENDPHPLVRGYRQPI